MLPPQLRGPHVVPAGEPPALWGQREPDLVSVQMVLRGGTTRPEEMDSGQVCSS